MQEVQALRKVMQKPGHHPEKPAHQPCLAHRKAFAWTHIEPAPGPMGLVGRGLSAVSNEDERGAL